MDLILLVSGAALFDSISTTQQLLVLVLLFSTQRPVLTSAAFIVGVFVAYLLCGLVGLALVDQLNAMLKLFLPNLDAISDPEYYLGQGLLGVALVVAGPVFWRRSQSKKSSSTSRWLGVLQRMNPWMALGLGAILSISGFPGALPYVTALEKIASFPAPGLEGVGFVVLYNVVYALPLVVLFGFFFVLRDRILPKLHLHTERFNTLATLVLLVAFGLVLVADSGVFWAFGKPLLSSRLL